MRENLLKKQPTWGLRRAQGTGQKSATPATLTKVILVLLTMLLLPNAAWGQDTEPTIKTYFSGFNDGITYANGTTGTWNLYTDSENTIPGTSDDPEGISLSNTGYIPYFDFTSNFQLYGTLKRGQKIARVEFDGNFNSLSLIKVGSQGAVRGEVITRQSDSDNKDLILTEDIDFSSGQYIDIYFAPDNTNYVVIKSIKIYNLQTTPISPITVAGKSPDSEGKFSDISGVTFKPATIGVDQSSSTPATLTLNVNGKQRTQYNYNGNGQRNPTVQPGELGSLVIESFSFEMIRGNADVNVTSGSLQYRVYKSGKEDGNWNSIEGNLTDWKDAQENLRTTARKDNANVNVAQGLSVGEYTLEIKYQCVANGEYYYLPDQAGSNRYNFSISTTGVVELQAAGKKKGKVQRFNLAGQPVGENYRGVVIEDGKLIDRR